MKWPCVSATKYVWYYLYESTEYEAARLEKKNIMIIAIAIVNTKISVLMYRD